MSNPDTSTHDRRKRTYALFEHFFGYGLAHRLLLKDSNEFSSWFMYMCIA